MENNWKTILTIKYCADMLYDAIERKNMTKYILKTLLK